MVFRSKVKVNMPIGDIGWTVNCRCELSWSFSLISGRKNNVFQILKTSMGASSYNF